MKENVIKFNYQGDCNYINYLISINQTNLLQELLNKHKLDEVLIKEIETLLNENRANIITLILGRTLSYKGFAKIVSCYSDIQLDLLDVNYSKENSVPMLYYNSPELKAPVLFFTWYGLQKLIKDFDFLDLLTV